MGAIHEKLRKEAPPTQIWHGKIASNPTDVSDRLSVVVPDFDPDYQWENCRWQSRDSTSLPVRGDACVVVLTNRGEAWVLAWWPF